MLNMTEFCPSCHRDKVICNLCHRDLCSNPDCALGTIFQWRTDLTHNRSSGNVCATCIVKRSQPSTIIFSEASVVHIGKEKIGKGSRNPIRWIKIATRNEKKPILFPIPADKYGDGQKYSFDNGDVIFIEIKDMKLGPQEDVYFAPEPIRCEVLHPEIVKLTMTFGLDNIYFSDRSIQLGINYGTKQKVRIGNFETTGSRGNLYKINTVSPSLGARRISAEISESLWHLYQPDFDLAWSHNKLKNKLSLEEQEDTFIEVTGDFRVSYNIDETVTLNATDNIEIVRENIMSLKRVIADSELAARWKEVRKELRDILQLKHVLTLDEVRQIFSKHEWAGNNVEEAIKTLTWKKHYEEEYFNHMKKLSGGAPAYFSDEGYFFRIDGKTVWEIPEKGKASYVFKGEPSEIVAKLGDLKRSEILELKNETPQALHFFIGRKVHHNFDDWKEGVAKLLEN